MNMNIVRNIKEYLYKKLHINVNKKYVNYNIVIVKLIEILFFKIN